MCELFAMSAARETRIRYELDLFAAEGGERHRNRDGWGVVFAEDRDAHVFREPSPAADSDLARMVVAREIPVRHLLAHVRRASRGDVALANTHPFSRIRQRRACSFAHNGTLGGLEHTDDGRRLLPERVGDTDSELAFLILLDRLEAAAALGDTHRTLAVFSDFARECRALGTANFLFFDGSELFVHADRRVFETEEGLSEPREPGLNIGRFAALAPAGRWRARGAQIDDAHPETLLFASVPLNPEGWEPLARGTCLAVRDGRIIARSF